LDTTLVFARRFIANGLGNGSPRDKELALQELAAVEAKVIEQRERIENLAEKVSFLSLIQEAQEEENIRERPRRESLEGEPNIYFSEHAGGETVYEVGWKTRGRQNWKTIGPDLDEARAYRDEQKGKVAS
jgi:hypothetical protein